MYVFIKNIYIFNKNPVNTKKVYIGRPNTGAVSASLDKIKYIQYTIQLCLSKHNLCKISFGYNHHVGCSQVL